MYSICKIERKVDQWNEFEGQVLFTWNIVNPNGPTIGCVGIRDCANEHEFEVFYRWLHFFGGETYILGYVNKDENRLVDELVEILKFSFLKGMHPAFTKFPMISAVPSSVTLADSYISTDFQKYLICKSSVFQGDDWGRQSYYLQKYGSDFFSRAAEETRSAVEEAKKDTHLTKDSKDFLKYTEIARGELDGYANWQPDQYESRSLTAQDEDLWWKTITNENFIGNSLGQLAYAWVGSIFQYQAGDTSRAIVESFESVNKFFQDNNHVMWPDSWNTESLLKNMGLIK